MPYAKNEGADLWYSRRGDAGPRALFIMGVAVPGEAWRPQVEPLSRRLQTLTFDNRGVGRSRAAPGAWTTRLLARDALAVADHAGWERFHVIGVSMGGMIAQELALAQRGRLLSLSLIATHPGGPSSWLPPRRSLPIFPRTVLGRRASRLRATAELLYPRALIDEGVETLSMGAEAIERAAPAILASQLSAVYRHDTARRLHRLAGLPTLVVRPGRDVLVDPWGSDRLARAIPGAVMARFDQAGHGINVQFADALNARLRSHVEAAERRTDPRAPRPAAPRSPPTR